MRPTRLLAWVVFWTCWFLVSSKGKRKHYTTSDVGRTFLMAFPNHNLVKQLKGSDLITAEFNFMTYEYEASVSMTIPNDMYSTGTGGYTVRRFKTKYDQPAVATIDKTSKVITSLPGKAIKIAASAGIVVQVTIYGFNFNADTFILPPTSSYARRFSVNIVAYIPLVLILAAHDLTVVNYWQSRSLTPNAFQVECSWNATCDYRVPADFVLNATTFAQLSWPLTSEKLFVVGSKISASRPILVLCGYVRSHALTPALPDNSYAKQFIIISTWHRATRSNFRRTIYFVPLDMTIAGQLSVSLHEAEKSEPIPYTTGMNPYVQVEIGSSNLFAIVTSNQLVSAVLIYGDYMVTTLLPEPVWPSYAMFKKPAGIPHGQKYLVYLVVRSSMKSGLVYGGFPVDKMMWLKVDQFRFYQYEYTTQLLTEDYVVIMQKDPRDTFAAYVTTLIETLMYPLGTHLGMVHHYPEDDESPCLPSFQTVDGGDGEDNDCDGKIDEEQLNGLDDDGDAIFDEDPATERAAGSWGHWMAWHCHVTCPNATRGKRRGTGSGKGSLIRERACDLPAPINKGDPCMGKEVEIGDGACSADCSKVPESCPLGKYGATCQGRCPEGCALGFCHRATGRCLGCRPGFKRTAFCEHRGYQEYRGPPEEGIAWWMVFLPVALTLLVLAFIVWDVMRRRRKRPPEEGEATEESAGETGEVAAGEEQDEVDIFNVETDDVRASGARERGSSADGPLQSRRSRFKSTAL